MNIHHLTRNCSINQTIYPNDYRYNRIHSYDTSWIDTPNEIFWQTYMRAVSGRSGINKIRYTGIKK